MQPSGSGAGSATVPRLCSLRTQVGSTHGHILHMFPMCVSRSAHNKHDITKGETTTCSETKAWNLAEFVHHMRHTCTLCQS